MERVLREAQDAPEITPESPNSINVSRKNASQMPEIYRVNQFFSFYFRCTKRNPLKIIIFFYFLALAKPQSFGAVRATYTQKPS